MSTFALMFGGAIAGVIVYYLATIADRLKAIHLILLNDYERRHAYDD